MKKSFPQIFFLLFVLLISMAFFGLIWDYLLAIFWAIVFAILFHTRYEKIVDRMPTKPGFAASLTLGYVLLVVIIPLLILGTAVLIEAGEVYENISSNDRSLSEQVQDLQDKIHIDDSVLSQYGLDLNKIEEKFSEFLTSSTQFVASKAVSLTQNFFHLILSFFLMLYVLFFFFKDGKELLRTLIWVLPIGDDKEWELLHRFESVTRATVRGSLLVALVQGTLGGILFWILGIPAAFIWGMIMVVASLLPVGSALIWGPWAIAFFIQGKVWPAIILVVVGAGFIGLIDNLLRPRLVGQDTKMPDYIILLSTLGGLAWFGLTGFVIGPIIAALFITCWQMLGKEYGGH